MNYIERYWRDAEPEDAIKEPPMVARFRDKDSDEWLENFVCGVDTEKGYWFSSSNGMPQTFWWKCQVYDAPDPGEGWRLIDTENEEPQDGDEIYDARVGLWTRRIAPFTPNVLSINRRRITPTVTYVPFTWEDREQLRGRWIYRTHANGTRDERMLDYAQQAANGDIEFGGFFPDTLVREWKFLDTGKPVGKEVTQ